ncbi:MAG TPA: winged helix-turn-helix domain-containing protein [Gemmatimonadaceae bacterium]|nr:winged helix-turn-helix domain-containing protein [Gemmatimonadaceae bacterium]
MSSESIAEYPRRLGGQPAASRAQKHSAEYAFEAVLETSPAGGRRLEDVLRAGANEFVLTSSDGRVAAKVRLRVAGLTRTRHQIGAEPIVVDWLASTVARGRQCVSLSRTELRLLAVLLGAEGQPLTRFDLIERVWPSQEVPNVERENALAVYVCCLRKRLAAIGAGEALVTLRGQGYQLKQMARKDS